MTLALTAAVSKARLRDVRGAGRSPARRDGGRRDQDPRPSSFGDLALPPDFPTSATSIPWRRRRPALAADHRHERRRRLRHLRYPQHLHLEDGTAGMSGRLRHPDDRQRRSARIRSTDCWPRNRSGSPPTSWIGFRLRPEARRRLEGDGGGRRLCSNSRKRVIRSTPASRGDGPGSCRGRRCRRVRFVESSRDAHRHAGVLGGVVVRVHRRRSRRWLAPQGRHFRAGGGPCARSQLLGREIARPEQFRPAAVRVYHNRQVAFEAFKAGAINYHEEYTSRFWATSYDFPAKDGQGEEEVPTARRPPSRAGTSTRAVQGSPRARRSASASTSNGRTRR